MRGSASTLPSGERVSRRSFLGGVTAGAVPFLAGCAGVSQTTYAASPVSISPDAADAIGLQEHDRGELTREEQFESLGIGMRTLTIRSPYANYQSESPATGSDAGSDNTEKWSVGALATPRVNFLRKERNPLAEIALQNHLYERRTQQFRDGAGLEQVDRSWANDSTRLTAERFQLFDQSISIFSRAGLRPGADRSILVLHYSNIEIDSDVIVMFAVQEWKIDETNRPIVGPDGHMTDAELAGKSTAAKTAFNAFHRET